MLDFLFLALGLILIIKGGDWFVSGGIRIAETLRMPRVVIGSTLVSLATTTPELVVSIVAGLRGQSELAVGNAVGSCICNIGLVLGLTAALKQVRVHLPPLRGPLVAMFLASTALFVMTMNLRLSRWQGWLLIALGAAYFAFDFWRHYRDRKPQDRAEAAAIEAEMTGPLLPGPPRRWGGALQFLAGAGLVVVGSRLLVDGAISVAERLGVPSIVLGLTVIAVGTSLPEMITAITSARREVSDLSVGNVLGANVANLTFIVGAAAVIQDVTMDRMTQLFNFPAMLLMMILLAWFLSTSQSVTRRAGALLLTVYGLYLALLLTLTLWSR